MICIHFREGGVDIVHDDGDGSKNQKAGFKINIITFPRRPLAPAYPGRGLCERVSIVTSRL